MIIIFSNNKDYSTYEVMQWLNYLGEKKVLRINEKILNPDLKKRTLIKGRNAEFNFEVDGESFSLSEIRAVWYRKGRDWLSDEFFEIKIENHESLSANLSKTMEYEKERLGDFINYIITKTTPVLGAVFKSNLNKLIVLEQAKSVGLKVPYFAISNSRKWISDFQIASKTGIISKAMYEGVYHFDSKKKKMGYVSYTEEILAENLEKMETTFPPSFVQYKVIKKYEIRAFFLEDTFYSMAIFSQNDEKTKVDFRKYNDEKPNRTIPYILPATIEKKVLELFNLLELNTGSIDLIVDENDDFYFLEINPVGQFGMVSTPCNYFLEKKVALNLIKKCQKN